MHSKAALYDLVGLALSFNCNNNYTLGQPYITFEVLH